MNTKIIPMLVLVTLVAISPLSAATKFVIGFPHIPLEKGERIVGMDVQFRGVHVRTISNIPKDWDVHLKLDPQPFPKISGGCGHAAGALMSTKDLPVFELEPFESSMTQITADATLLVAKDFETQKVREIKITLKGIRP